MRRNSLLLALACAGCATTEAPTPPPRGLPIQEIIAVRDTFKQYVNALLLLNNPDPQDWARAWTEIDVLYPYAVAVDERAPKDNPRQLGLIEKARAGDDVARRELGRRGQIYDTYMVYWRPFNRAAWNAARSTIERLSIDGDGTLYLAQILLQMLINGQFRESWPELRYQICQLGDHALPLLEGVIDAKVKATPGTVIFKEDDLIQLFATIVQFGDRGAPMVKKLISHPNHNVRKAVARAIGETKEVRYLAELNGLLREESSPNSWIVRAAAANAFENFESARKVAGPMLLSALKAEASRRDDTRGIIIVRIYGALGRVHYVDAVPELVKDLDVPNVEWQQAIMVALYQITTVKQLLTVRDWKGWFAREYVKWREDWRKHHGE
jgi:hypothetical protein